MIKKGYDIVLFFLSTSNVEINIRRVKNRVAEGGHDIAKPIINHRYKMGLTYLRSNLHLFKKTYLLDNSGETALLMAELESGILLSKENNAPEWVQNALYIVERIKR